MIKKDRIKQIVYSHKIVLFMKGTPDRPCNHHSMLAVNALADYATEIYYVDVLKNSVIRAFLPKYSNIDNFPQLFINGELLGGGDIIADLAETGELIELINEATREEQRLVS